jgi:hypothetical protein
MMPRKCDASEGKDNGSMRRHAIVHHSIQKKTTHDYYWFGGESHWQQSSINHHLPLITSNLLLIVPVLTPLFLPLPDNSQTTTRLEQNKRHDKITSSTTIIQATKQSGTVYKGVFGSDEHVCGNMSHR